MGDRCVINIRRVFVLCEMERVLGSRSGVGFRETRYRSPGHRTVDLIEIYTYSERLKLKDSY